MSLQLAVPVTFPCCSCHMRNEQLRPGYNVPAGVESEYVLSVQVYQTTTDSRTLIPFLDGFYDSYGHKPDFCLDTAMKMRKSTITWKGIHKFSRRVPPIEFRTLKTQKKKVLQEIGLKIRFPATPPSYGFGYKLQDFG